MHRLSFSCVKTTTIILYILITFEKCDHLSSMRVDSKYYLVAEGYNLAKNMFAQQRANYEELKAMSLEAIDTFLNLVSIMNSEMSRKLRNSVIKLYETKYFQDFTKYVMTYDEIIEIIEHCIIDPNEKILMIREQFQRVINNFEDVRNFNSVEKCQEDLPDEVSTAHCILHHIVMFNETMQDSMITIVKIKTRQHALDMNQSLYSVQRCLNSFVPSFFEQIKDFTDVYTNNCSHLKIINVSITDFINDSWRIDDKRFLSKWYPVVNLLNKRLSIPYSFQNSLINLFQANLTTADIYSTLFN